MAGSFTLSSSKGCFVKACLMLKDASGSLSPLSKPVFPPLVSWGSAFRPNQTNWEGVQGGRSSAEPEKGSQVQVPTLQEPFPGTAGLGDSALGLPRPQGQLLSPTHKAGGGGRLCPACPHAHGATHGQDVSTGEQVTAQLCPWSRKSHCTVWWYVCATNSAPAGFCFPRLSF